MVKQVEMPSCVPVVICSTCTILLCIGTIIAVVLVGQSGQDLQQEVPGMDNRMFFEHVQHVHWSSKIEAWEAEDGMCSAVWCSMFVAALQRQAGMKRGGQWL